MRYVLSNARKHGDWSATDRPDPFSSGPWSRQWYQTDFRRPLRRSPVLPPRRHELTSLPSLSLDDTPGPRWSEYGSLAEMLAT